MPPIVKSLSAQLVEDGLSQQQAVILEQAFGLHSDFVVGLNIIVAILAMDEAPDYAPPAGLPWSDIWDNIQRCPQDKQVIFENYIQQFPDDVRDVLQDVVKVKVSNKRTWLQNLGQGNTANKTPEYYRSILAHLGYQFRYNRCTQMIECNGKPLNDFIAAQIRSKARAAGIKAVSDVEDVYVAWAWENKYHPVQRYLENLKPDGADHIGNLCQYFKDDKNVFEMFLRRWLIGACARAFIGTRNRVMILDGPQEIGKSSFVRWLGNPLSEYFSEGPILPDEKDCKLSLLSTWIWEISEWGNTARKADREALKAFLTTVKVQERAAYGRYKTEGQAMSSFMATTNNENGLLTDPTGNTRFMIARVDKIDWRGYTRNIDVDQIWAQAMSLYVGGEPWELDPVEFAMATDINLNYLTIDIVEETIKHLFEINPGGQEFLGSLEIMEFLKGVGNLKAGIEIDTRRMASALTRLGLEKPRPGSGVNRGQRGYYGIKRKGP